MALNAIRRTFTDRRSSENSTSGPTDSSEDSPPRVRMDPKGRVLEKCLVMPCLDRPFLPGMLYDARSHTIFPQILSQDQLSQEIEHTEYPSQSHELLMDESTSDKMSHLDVGASLSLTLLSGLVSISGSARYTQDNKSSKKHARVSLKYRSTHCCEDFPLAKLKSLPNDFPAMFSPSSDSSPTHIVFRVVYGSQVIMMFDVMSRDDENHMNIQGELQAQLHLGIPEISGSADVEAHISKEDKDFCRRIAMKFYGDGIKMESNPTSFEEAQTVYQNLPLLCGKKGAPQSVWLYPLCNLQPSAPRLVREPNSSAALVVHKVIDDIQDLTVRSSDALKNIQVKSLHDQLFQFQKWLGNKKSELMSQVAVLLPREHKGEQCIEDFIKKFRKTFSYDDLSTWLKQKEEEVTILLSFLSVLPRDKVQSAFQDGELVSCYARSTSLLYIEFNVDRKDPFLESLLEGGEVIQAEKSPWFRDLQKVKDMKSATDTFRCISLFMNEDAISFAVTTNFAIGAGSVTPGAIACIKEFGVDEQSLTSKEDSGWFFVVSCLGDSLMLTVKDGCMDPGTPIVVDKKNTSPARQLWKKQYVYVDYFYLVSKLGDNIKLGFRNNRAVTMSDGAILWQDPLLSDRKKAIYAKDPETVLDVFHNDTTPGAPTIYYKLKAKEAPNQLWYFST